MTVEGLKIRRALALGGSIPLPAPVPYPLHMALVSKGARADSLIGRCTDF
jgi:hypothetical protein